MAEVSINGTTIGNALQQILVAPDMQPGDPVSYELAKTIYLWHPLGSKMADAPIEAAQSQKRKISFGDAPESVVEAFTRQWEKDNADNLIFGAASTARIYGISSLAVLSEGEEPSTPLDFQKLWNSKIAFNVLDPLNTAGSLVLNQNPNDMDFQKHASIAVAGKQYARNRSVTLLNERPLYISYTPSAFGFSGRSVYQRPLYPLRSFINTMVTDDMVSKKAGLIIAFIKQPGSIIDGIMAAVGAVKRSLLKVAVVDNVLSMGPEDKVESLNLQNLDGAFGNSRTNILKNIATGAKMPAVMLENETLTEGFGEGTEDAKVIAQFINGIRVWMSPLYAFFDPIIMRRAINPEFYATLQKNFPEAYGSVDYETAFYKFQADFTATWPNLLEEPESERIKVSDVKFKGLLAAAEVLAPMLDPENKTKLVAWAIDNLNEEKLLFGTPLQIDFDRLESWGEEMAERAANAAEAGGNEDDEPGNVGGVRERLDSYDEAVRRLPVKRVERKVG